MGSVPGPDVDAPGPEPARAAEAIRDSSVRPTGSASACGTIITGSGVIEPDLIVTNAHVVAAWKISLCVFDQQLRSAPRWSTSIRTWTSPGANPEAPRSRSLARTRWNPRPAAVAGFPVAKGSRQPRGGCEHENARGESIYGETGVERDVYVLRGSVEQGMSGGALTDEF